MPGDDGVSSLRESMKQDYRHIGTLARNTASFILGRLLVRIKMLLTFFFCGIRRLAVPWSLDALDFPEVDPSTNWKPWPPCHADFSDLVRVPVACNTCWSLLRPHACPLVTWWPEATDSPTSVSAWKYGFSGFIAQAGRTGSLTSCMCGKRKHNPSFTAVNLHVCQSAIVRQQAYSGQVLEDTKSKVGSLFRSDPEVVYQSGALVTIECVLK